MKVALWNLLGDNHGCAANKRVVGILRRSVESREKQRSGSWLTKHQASVRVGPFVIFIVEDVILS
jgi:hypothetical protein